MKTRLWGQLFSAQLLGLVNVLSHLWFHVTCYIAATSSPFTCCPFCIVVLCSIFQECPGWHGSIICDQWVGEALFLHWDSFIYLDIYIYIYIIIYIDVIWCDVTWCWLIFICDHAVTFLRQVAEGWDKCPSCRPALLSNCPVPNTSDCGNSPHMDFDEFSSVWASAQHQDFHELSMLSKFKHLQTDWALFSQV